MTVVGFHVREPHSSVLMRWFQPEAWLELRPGAPRPDRRGRPFVLKLLLTQPVEDYDLSELRYVVTERGAAPAGDYARLFRRAERGNPRGLRLDRPRSSPPRRPAAHLGSVGTPVPGIEVRIDDPDRQGVDEISCAPRGDARLLGVPELTAEVLRDGSCTRATSASSAADGYLRVVDRKKDLIIHSGFNVFPRDVEELLEHPSVAAAGVVGRPTPCTARGGRRLRRAHLR